LVFEPAIFTLAIFKLAFLSLHFGAPGLQRVPNSPA
jgi:hypothetical protein